MFHGSQGPFRGCYIPPSSRGIENTRYVSLFTKVAFAVLHSPIASALWIDT
jgi:hypothetical protein